MLLITENVIITFCDFKTLINLILLFTIFLTNRMSIIFYHKNLKVLQKKDFTPNDGGDENYYKSLGNDLILQGFKEGRNIKEQLKILLQYVLLIQNKKMYKLEPDEIEYYCLCILALWKAGIYCPDDPASPIYIAPKKKRRKKSNSKTQKI